MKRKILVTLFISTLHNACFSQTTIDQVLKEVEKNNKSLLSEKQYWEAQKLSYKTGLTPENPKAEFDYMIGRPEGAGNQRDIVVTQAFDFPTSYGKRKSVSNLQLQNADYQLNISRQEILLEAKLLCLDYIFRSKLQNELQKRLQNADKLLSATSAQINNGQASILDLNKVKLLHLDIKNQADLNVTEIKTTQHKLDALNGGSPLNVSGLIYIVDIALPPFEQLDSLIEANDPVVKSVKQEREIAVKQLSLTKSLALPKLEGGYHQQAILGQKYEGFHLGMTIPLWENKNRVKTQQAKVLHNDMAIQDHRTQHYFENKQSYERYLHWKNIYDEYQAILSSANNEELLNKALQGGQINLIEYLMETRYFYDAINRALEAERELQITISRLYKFVL
jgi:cobalt-zinc-cadmium efflux system outer membrane protein